MWRRGFIHAIIYYSPTSVGSKWQMLLLLCVYIPTGLLHYRYRPFRDRSVDVVEAASILSSITMLLMGGYIQSVNTAGDRTSELGATGTWSTDVAAGVAFIALICFVVVWLNAALNLSREDIIMSDQGNFMRGMMKALLCCWNKCVCEGPIGDGSYHVTFYLRDLCEYFTIKIEDSFESDLEDYDEEAVDAPLTMRRGGASMQMDHRTDVLPAANASENGIQLMELSCTPSADSIPALPTDTNSNHGSEENVLTVAYVDIATDSQDPSCAAVWSL